MSADPDNVSEFMVETRVVPIRKWRGATRPMTAFEAFVWALSRYIRQPLETFTWRSRITPALRERCVDYVLRGGQRGAWNIAQEAEKIAGFIAKGEL